VNEWDFTTEYKAILTPPPMWKGDTEEEYRERCKTLCDQAIQEALSHREKPSMGMIKVMGQDIYKARFTKRSTRPLCKARSIERLKAFKEAYFAFKAQFQEASTVLREAVEYKIHRNSQIFDSKITLIFMYFQTIYRNYATKLNFWREIICTLV
jgi:hypothetical protein